MSVIACVMGSLAALWLGVYGFDNSAALLGYAGAFMGLALAAISINESLWRDDGLITSAIAVLILALASLVAIVAIDLTSMPAPMQTAYTLTLPALFALGAIVQSARLLQGVFKVR